MMAASVRRHLANAGVNEAFITTIAPQHDGRVGVRANCFYEIILGNPSWVDALRSADAVFVAAHSQGSIVAALLLARLCVYALFTYSDWTRD